MSSENEDQVLLKSPDENKPESEKVSKISYTRDFLLSLSELDVCKKLPNGFDASILSEFGDASRSMRGEYAPVSQSRSESSGSYMRVNQGRWETRSTGTSDKDGGFQSDRESIVQDSGRCFRNQTRRGRENSEHDGLLGSGAFLRPTGYTGSSAPKARGNSHYQLNRSTEPYQPPRPYKATPYSKKDYTDLFNDETFGFVECSSDDRAEEERKRRASFELMRKEQQKVLQEKHKQTLDNHKENIDSDIIALLGNSTDENSMSENKSDNPVVASLSNSDSSTCYLHIQAPASRPLVPPGFSSAHVEKNLPVQSSSISLASETGTAIVEDKRSLIGIDYNQDKGNILAAFMPINMNKNAPKISSQLSVDAFEKLMAPILSAEILNPTVDFEKISGKTIVQSENEVWEDDIIIIDDSSCKKGRASEIMKTVSQDHSTTILEKLFSSALSKNYASTPNNPEHQGVMEDEEKWGPAVFESSMFSHWFSEEEIKPEDDFSSRELLSLIVSNEKVGSQVSTSNEKASENIPLNLTFESVVTSSKLPTSPATSSTIRAPVQYSKGDNKSPSSVVLTCEDLELSILAEVKDTCLNPSPSFLGGCTPFDDTSEKQKANVDDSASHHLLSLLQKGANLKQSVSSPRPDIIESTKRFSGSHVDPSFDRIFKNAGMVQSSEQTLTLEALFGVSFMNALHSAEAPVSAQRGSVGTENNIDVLQPHGVFFPRADEDSLSTTFRKFKSNKPIHEGDIIALNNTQKDHNIPGHSPIATAKLGDTGIEKGQSLEIQLPEEDSLITVGDTLNSISTDPFAFENVHKGEFLPEVQDHSAKFLDAILRDGERSRTHGSDGATQMQKGPLEMVDPNDLYHRLHGRPSSHFPHQMDESRPSFLPFDHLANRNPQMKFAGPDGMHHDPRHPFPHHDPHHIPHQAFSNIGAPRFDNAAAHHPMLQRVPVPENIPPHHPMHGFPRSVPLSYPINHMHGYMPEMNNMHNWQPNFGGRHGMRLPGPGIVAGGGPHPEAFERLIEMEMRANSKQIHPPMGSHIPGIYGHENINFRYR